MSKLKQVTLFLKSGETVYFYADAYYDDDKTLKFFLEETLVGTFRKYAVIGFCFGNEEHA